MVNSFDALLVEALENSWPALARPKQLPPSSTWWQIWLLLAGCGFGKTRTLAEWVCGQVACGQARRKVWIPPLQKSSRRFNRNRQLGVLRLTDATIAQSFSKNQRPSTVFKNQGVLSYYAL